MTDERPEDRPAPAERPPGTANAAPDAVKDPSEKTDGKPGVPPGGEEADPGGG